MIAFTVCLVASVASAVMIPALPGKFGVASSLLELVDTSRQDPYASSCQTRRLMLSAFYPAGLIESCDAVFSPYMPANTAAVYDTEYSSFGIPNGTFDSLDLSLCAANSSKKGVENTSFPIILFSPGLGNSRLLYNVMARSLASQGFVVITIDHPYDASIVEFPDGSVVLAADITTDDQITQAVDFRRMDVSFVIDQLHNPCIRRRLFHDVADIKYVDNIMMFGHSLGGATAAAAMLRDRRIMGGINLDGSLFGPVLDHGLHCPFAIFAHEGKNLTTDPSWEKMWLELDSTRLELAVVGSQHGSFTDLLLLTKVLGLTDYLSEEVASLIGTIDGERMLEILGAYMGAFFDFAAGRTEIPLITGSDTNFPEMEILEEDIRGRCAS